ncbi:MAG TPA: hypothetical protein VFL95_06560 [Gemmatimonadales bacterium]|nr:hypothetical protein [Gemmatimonadales bacterium]
MTAPEIHLERLLGRKVRDPDGRSAGSIEEIAAEDGSGEWLVTEYITGPVGALERLAAYGPGLWLLGWLGAGKSPNGYRIPWDQLDLSEPEHPRLRCLISELKRADSAGPPGGSPPRAHRA